jgi:hypothetical protein
MNCVNWNNQEAVSESRSQQLKSAFVEELQGKQGDSPVATSNCTVSVFLERTPAQIVVTADVENGGDRRYLFAAIPRTEVPAESSSTSTLRLEKELIWQQGERILDALFVRGENGASDRLVVLQRDLLNVYEKQAGEWRVLRSKPLGVATVAQRASRGELSLSLDQPDRLKLVFASRTPKPRALECCSPQLAIRASGGCARTAAIRICRTNLKS